LNRLLSLRSDSNLWVLALSLDLVTAGLILSLGPTIFEFLLLVTPMLIVTVFWIRDDGFDRFHFVYIPSVLLFPTVLRDFEGAHSGIRAEHILIFWSVGILVFGMLLGRKIRVPRTLALLLSIWILAGLVSTVVQLVKTPTFDEMKSISISLQGFGRPLVLLAIFYSIGVTRSTTKSILFTLALSGGLLSGFMVLQLIEIPFITEITLENFDRKHLRVIDVLDGKGDVVGTFDGQHNHAAIFAVIFTTTGSMLSLAYWSINRTKIAVVLFGITLVGYVGLFGTFSRSGFIAGVVALAVVVANNIRGSSRSSRIGIGVLTGSIAFAAIFVQQFTNYFTHRFGTELFNLSHVLDDPRVTVASPKLLELWKSSPIVGNGFSLNTAGDIGLLLELATRGIAGLLALSVLIGYLIWIAWVNTNHKDEITRYLALTILSLAVAFMSVMFVIHPFDIGRVSDIFWILSALLMADLGTRSFDINLSSNLISRLRLSVMN
jgi:hypothetical protein